MRIFKAEKIKDNSIYLYKDDVHHILDVLHKKTNDIIFCSFETIIYECRIKDIKPFLLEVISQKEYDLKPYPLNIYMAVIDKKNFEIVVRSLNELNCNSITPVYLQRSQHNIILDEKRMDRIVEESNKQCCRTNGLIINKSINFNQLIELINNQKENWFFAYENEESNFQNISIKENKPINLIIGPEGGFTIQEAETLINNNVNSIKLTNTILRAETAAIYLASVLIEKIKEENHGN